MKSHNKLHLGGYLSAVLVLLGVGVATPATQGYVTWFNEDIKNLDDDTPVLEAITASEYKVSYVYHNEDGDKKTETIGATAKVIDGATAATFNDTLRVLGIDLSAITLSQTPEYGAGGQDHYILIELPESSKTLFSDTVASYCAGFVLERGAGASIDDDDIAQSYTYQVGSGDAILFQTTVRSEDEDIGDANTNEVGTCHGVDDPDDTEPEFGDKLSLNRIQGFLNDAYIKKGDEATPLWIKVLGVRAPANVTEEEGDVFDVALQLYTYPETKMGYGFTANIQLAAALVLLASAALMTAFLNVPMEHIRPNIFRTGRTRGGEGGDA